MRLAHVHYDADGRLVYPRQHDQAPESALLDYLDEAARLLYRLPDPDTAPARDLVESGALTQDFEHLRWFELAAVEVSGP